MCAYYMCICVGLKVDGKDSMLLSKATSLVSSLITKSGTILVLSLSLFTVFFSPLLAPTPKTRRRAYFRYMYVSVFNLNYMYASVMELMRYCLDMHNNFTFKFNPNLGYPIRHFQPECPDRATYVNYMYMMLSAWSLGVVQHTQSFCIWH